MNIIICGLAGTGKTTLSKMIAQKFKFKYISDFKICNHALNENDIINFIKNNDNYVLDLAYSISPASCFRLKNVISYFLGFVSIDEKVLFNLMNSKAHKISIEQIIQNKKFCKKMKEECLKFNIPFYDINKDRQIILDDILDNITKLIK